MGMECLLKVNLDENLHGFQKPIQMERGRHFDANFISKLDGKCIQKGK